MVVMQHCHPKGCYCQVGSVFKTALFLTLIVGVSTAIAVWIYQNKFVSTHRDKVAVEEGNGISKELDLIQLLGAGGAKPDLYIDSGGTLRRLVSDSRRALPGEGGEFGLPHLSPAGERTRTHMPLLPVEAIDGLRRHEQVNTTKRPRTILEEILQHLDSDEEESVELAVGQFGEETGPE